MGLSGISPMSLLLILLIVVALFGTKKLKDLGLQTPYWRFNIKSHQQKLLIQLKRKLKNRAYVAYGCSVFHKYEDLYKHIEKGHALPGNPPLTAAQKEAFALLAEVNEELHLSMSFEIGDIQILNSHVTMHSRTSYEDWPDPEKRRRLWRLWLRNEQIRPRPDAFAHRTGGIYTPQTTFRVNL